MSDKNYRTLYEELLTQYNKTESALYSMSEELAKERRTGGVCNVCAGSGLLLTGDICGICSGTGHGCMEAEGLRKLALDQQSTIAKLIAEQQEKNKRLTA